MGRVRVLGEVTCHTWANKGQLGMHVLMGFLFLWVLWVPALQDGRVSASAVYDGQTGVNGRTFVAESDRKVEFEAHPHFEIWPF